MAGNGVFTFTAPDLDDFTWVNQGSATAVEVNDCICMYTPYSAARDHHLLVKACPSIPYTVTAYMSLLLPNDSYRSAGLILRNSSSGKLVAFMGTQNFEWYVGKLNDVATWVAAYANPQFPKYSPVGMRIRTTSGAPATRYFDISLDGVNWWTIHSGSNDDFMTPDQIGIHVQAGSTANRPALLTLMSWAEA